MVSETITLKCAWCGRQIGQHSYGDESELATRLARAFESRVLCDPCIAKRDEYEAAERIRQMVVRLQSDGLVTPEVLACTFEASDSRKEAAHRDAWAMARSYSTDARMPTNLWIHGSMGTGKTWLARSILNAQLRHDVSVGEVSGDTINRVSGYLPVDAERKARLYGRVHVLLIDDIDGTEWTGRVAALLRSIVNERRDAERRTIATANMTGNAFGQMLAAVSTNPAAVSSLIDRFHPVHSIEMSGDSFRRMES